MLHPDDLELRQFFSAMFLHGSWWHLIGNMVFLWVFGNAVNDRFGQAGYLAFYLAGGVLSGLGYVLLSGHLPVLGASGAISAVTGAYLVLLPRVRVTLLVVFYFITFVEISSLYFLAFQFVWNFLLTLPEIGTPSAGGGVAYAAHSTGYVFGIAMALGLLAGRLLPREPFDLLNLFRSYGRRQRYRRMVAQGYDPFRFTGGAGPGQFAPPRVAATTAPNDLQVREMELRRDISQALAGHDLAAAAERYLELVRIVDGAILPRAQQLDVANQLMAAGSHAAAADAYERFLRHYANHEHAADIYLMLGLLYGRYLHQDDRAEPCLERAVEGLHDHGKADLAREELQAVHLRRRG